MTSDVSVSVPWQQVDVMGPKRLLLQLLLLLQPRWGAGTPSPTAGIGPGASPASPTAGIGPGSGPASPTAGIGPGSGPASPTAGIGPGSGPASPTAGIGPGSGPASPTAGIGPGSGPASPTAGIGPGSGPASPTAGIGPGSGPASPTAGIGPGSGPASPTAGDGPGSASPTAGDGPGSASQTAGIGPGSGPASPTAGDGPGPATEPGGMTPGGSSGPGPPSPEGGSSAEPEPSATPGVQGDPSAPEACLPTCICNLHSGSCDINCCCDTDCYLGCDLGDSRATFSFCLPGSTRIVNQVCVEKSLIFRNNTPYHTEIVTDPSGYESLFCVQLSDSKLNYFQQPQKVKKSDFSVYLAQYGGPSFIPPSQDQPSSSAFYRAGDPIQTYFAASSVLSTLRQPVGMGANGLCIDGNHAGFLESKSTSCTRTFTNLSSSCTTDPALDAASYYRDFTILKVPVNMTVVQLMQVRITPVTQPGAPQMDGNTCHNVVSEVIYEIEFNGTHGIQNVSVQLKVTSVSGNSLQQRFTLQFWSRTPSYTLPRSGNPGYIIGAPLLSLNNGARQQVTILQSQGDGICSQTLRYKVQFGMNVRTSCQLRLHTTLRSSAISSLNSFRTLGISQTMEDGNCSYFQEKLYQALQGVSSPQALAIIGSAEPTQRDQWTSLIVRNCSMQAGNCASCCMVPVSLKIQVLWAEVGLQSNPQSQVLGARYWYQCQSLKSLSMTMVPLTTVVAFTDMTEWPEPPRSQPSTYWKLPFDFFFPFKVALNGGISCQGDLAGAFLMSLTFCSILSF
ncbi:tectonic-3 isoform X2 [Caretta caretta]|uniref:tectonic-3 isoform X2 n=1 Tax=Caretta caretta TaxID=8467 RepID=UPI003F4B0CE3